MNASILKRTLVIGGVVALPWIGCSLWSAHRERSEKRALAEEIRAEMAARQAARPEEPPGLVDLTREYESALLAWGDVAIAQRVKQYMSFQQGGSVPSDVAQFVESRRAVLDGFAAAVGALPPGRVTLKHDQWERLGSISGGLRIRGWTQSRTGDLDGVLSTVRLLRRIAADASASTAVDSPIWPANMALGMERAALDHLRWIALQPSLGEGQAAEALAIAKGPWRAIGGAISVARVHLDDRDELCLAILGDDAWERLKERNVVQDSPYGEIVGGIFQGGGRVRRGSPEGLPSAAVVRRIREITALQKAGYERRDGAAVTLGGEFDIRSDEDLGGGWCAGMLSPFPYMARSRWAQEVPLPVLRAALALRLHEIRGGGVPPTLDALVPALLEAVPVDPWTGEKVRYTARPGGWILEAGHPEKTWTHHTGWEETQRPYRIEK